MVTRKYRINVRYFGYLKDVSGKNDEEINISSSENVTVEGLLKYLSDKYGDRFMNHIYDAYNNLRLETTIILDGNTIVSTKLKEKLRPNSEVQLAFVPMFGGG